MEMPGKAVVEQAQRKDAEAFAVLVRAYERVALSVAFGVLGDSAAAGDVAQDAFLRAWERIDELRDPERFGAWLCGIVRHLALDQLRRRRPARSLEQAGAPADPARWTHDPTQEAGRRERHESIAEAIAGLDETSRTMVAMRYYEDLSSRQIAELLDLSPAAVDMRLSRARKQLRALLADADGLATANEH